MWSFYYNVEYLWYDHFIYNVEYLWWSTSSTQHCMLNDHITSTRHCNKMITSRVLNICTFPVLGLWRIRTCMFPKYSINSVSVSVFCKKKILYHIWSARLSILLIIKSLFNLLALWYVTRLSILCLLVLSPHSPSISPWLSQDLWDSCPYCLRKYSKYRRDTDWPLQYNSWQEEDCSYSQEVG